MARWRSRRTAVEASSGPSPTARPAALLATVPGLFARQVEEDPNRPAIVGVPKPLTYAELARLVDGYREALAAAGPPGGRIALLLPHDASIVAAALGAMQCGHAIVVLNGSDPPTRMGQMCDDVEPQLVLTDAGLAERAGATRCPSIVVLDLADLDLRRGSPAVGAPGVGDEQPVAPDDTAVLISTSGSTGRPKLVRQTQRNVVHNAVRYSHGVELQPEDRVAWLASLSSGQGLATVTATLLSGAALAPYSMMDRGLAEMPRWIEQHGISVLDMVPSVFRNFVRTLGPGQRLSPRRVRLASERALPADFEAFRTHFGPDATLTTVLGSSETGVAAHASFRPTDVLPDGPLPVGSAAEGIEISLVDEDGTAVPTGREGQLVVRSSYLSPGYWHDDELTARRFRSGAHGAELWTGDVGYLDPEWGLVITGRIDSQVKVKGNRVHLEEVESVIARQPGVSAAKVLSKTTSRGDVTLVAFVAGAPGSDLQGPRVQAAVRQVLPGYAVPTAVVVLEALPVTAHGKVDREQLARLLETQGQDAGTGRGSGSQIEEVVADLWREAFDRPDIDLDEPFLTAGGDSLAAAVVAAGVHDIFGVELSLEVFAGDPTVAEMARMINQQRATGAVSEAHELPAAPRDEPVRLSCAQAGIWQRGSEQPARVNIAAPFRIKGRLDVSAWHRSIEDVVNRHDIFRTTYGAEAGGEVSGTVQRPPVTVDFVYEDLRGDVEAAAAADRVLDAESARPFDVSTGPLLRFRLLQLRDEEFRFIRSSHHLVSDPSSWNIFFNELRTCYEARIDGREPALGGPPPRQFADYARWERDLVRREPGRFRAAVDHWKKVVDDPPPPLVLPLAPPAVDGSAGASTVAPGLVRWGLPAPDVEGLDRLAREAKATFVMSRLAPYAALAAHESVTDDVLIGMSVSMRSRSDLQSMIGPITNFGLLRPSGAADRTFRQWLDHISALVIDLSTYCDVPFRLIAPELVRRGLRIPSVEALFAVAHRLGPIAFGGIEIDALPRACPDLQVFRVGVRQADEVHSCWAEFDPTLHNAGSVQAFLGRLQALVEMVVADPDEPLEKVFARL